MLLKVRVIELGQDNLSKQERRQLKLEQKREAKLRMHQEFETKEKKNQYLLYGGAIIAVVIVVGIFLSLPKPEPVDFDTGSLSFPLGNIHWHTTPLVYVCGENIPTPTPTPGKHLGSNLLHTHDDRQAHIEGRVNSPSQITVGAYMANIGMRFSETQLTDKNNGDLCPSGQAGSVKLFVNGTENNQLNNYVMRDGDRIEMRFE